MAANHPDDPDSVPQIVPSLSSGRKWDAARAREKTFDSQSSFSEKFSRALVVVAFLGAAQLITLFVAFVFNSRYTTGGMCLLTGVPLFVGCAVHLKRQIVGILAQAEPSRADPSRLLSFPVGIPIASSALIWLVVIVFWGLAVFNPTGIPRRSFVEWSGFWEGVCYLSALVCLISTVRYVARLMSFKWAHVTIVWIALVLAQTPVELPFITTWIVVRDSLQAEATVTTRRNAFKTFATELNEFAQSNTCWNAIKATGQPKYFEEVGSFDGNLVVLGFEERAGWGGYDLVASPEFFEAYVPQRVLAHELSNVEYFVITQAIGSNEEADVTTPLIMEVLLFRWPDKVLLASAKLGIQSTWNHSDHHRSRAAADALYDFLSTASDASADPKNLPPTATRPGAIREIKGSRNQKQVYAGA